MSKTQMVCLCGSSKFIDAFHEVNAQLTLEGKIVLSIACVTSSECPEVTEEEKHKLDLLHLKKIDIADRVHVLNVGGYIGLSTMREIRYALRWHKIVTFLHEPDPILIEILSDFEGKAPRNSCGDI